MSFLITSALNSVSDSWLASFSFSIVSETSSVPFICSLFLCLPIVCETLPVSLCFLSCSVLSPWVFGVKFCDKIPVRFSGTVSLVSRSYWSWAVVYVGSVYVFGFSSCWVFLWWVFPTSWLSEGQSVPHLLFSVVQVWAGCVGAGSSVLQAFEAFLLLLFHCLFLVISFLFICIFR